MKNNRIWEVDSLRGIAIIMMIIYHLIFDLVFFLKINIALNGFWKIFQVLTGFLFLFIVGISLTLSYSPNFSKFLKRGIKIFSWGLLISLATYLYIGYGFVIFGILHLIGLSIILAYPLIKKKYTNLILGLLFIVVGLFLQNMKINSIWLLWIGFIPKNLFMLDYYPILPWFGCVLLGLFTGNVLLPKVKLKDYSKLFGIRILTFLGRKSLFIYLVHQPLLIGLLKLLVYYI